jgi:beta-galactosidase GanA
MSTETLPELEEKRRPLERILLGTAYNIFHDEFSTDQAFCQRVDRDLANMRAAHLNAVLVFPVGQWDPTTRQLQWDRTDYLVRRLQEQGLDLVPILFKEQQCRHYLPIWQMHENPSIWSAHLSPHPSSPDPNSREDADINHPAVASALDEYFEAVINRYRQSPSLLLYNVWNELSSVSAPGSNRSTPTSAYSAGCGVKTIPTGNR